MSIESPQYGHSPQIEMWLEVGGETLPLAQVGRRCLLLADGHELAPQTTGRIVVTIDGRRICRSVVLTDGVRAGSWGSFL